MPRQLYYNELDNLSPNSTEEKMITTVNKKDKPKRNRSAFIIFSSEMRPLIKANEKQKSNSNEMMVKLADLWKGLNEEERKKYHDMAEKEKVRYLLELNEFYQTHPYDIIQNKTKNNHVKKPCSAYGLFLKETKKTVKLEKPDLKMADVLKIVAERWKVLDEKTRKVYQEQAKAEKEAVKGKINEQTSEDDKCYAASLPQKRLQSQKRVKKALLKENIKLSTAPLMKIEEAETSDQSPFEEAVFANLSETNDSEITSNFNTCLADEMLFNNLTNLNLNFNFNRMPSIEPIFTNLKENAHERKTSKIVEVPMDVELKPKKSSEFLMDLLNFQSIQQDLVNFSAKNSFVNQASTCSAIRSKECAKPSRQVLNDALISAFDFEENNLFNFELFNVKLLTLTL